MAQMRLLEINPNTTPRVTFLAHSPHVQILNKNPYRHTLHCQLKRSPSLGLVMLDYPSQWSVVSIDRSSPLISTPLAWQSFERGMTEPVKSRIRNSSKQIYHLPTTQRTYAKLQFRSPRSRLRLRRPSNRTR